jgi:hypothetical protein
MIGAVSSKIRNSTIAFSTTLKTCTCGFSNTTPVAFARHPFGNEHNNVVTLSNKLSGLERLTIDNLARSLDELDKALVAFAMTGERPDRLWHRMLEIEVVGKHRKQPVQVIAFERSVDSLDQFNIAILVHVR